VYLCSCLRYSACKSYLFCVVLYCHLWPAWLYHIFPHYLIYGTIFGKKVIEQKICVLIFSTILSENFLILRRIQRGTIVNVCKSSCKVPFILVRFYQTWIFSTDFRYMPKYQFHGNSFSGRRVVPCGRTDTHDEDKSRFSQNVSLKKNINKQTLSLWMQYRAIYTKTYAHFTVAVDINLP
jgi:hypothetical protein